MGLGAALFALIVSNVSALVNEMSSADIYYRTVMDQLTDYARQRALPPKLHYAIRRYFVHLREFKLFSSDADLLDALSPELRAKVMLHTYKSASENSSLLKLLDAASFGTLCAETEQKSYAAGEALYEPEDSAWCIYYLVHGLAKRLTSNDVEIEQLRAGAVFGDRGLFFHRPRQDRVVCTTPCDFVIFPRNAVLVALRKNPDWIAAVEAEESLKLWAHAIFVAKQKARILMLSRRLIDYLNTTDGSEIRKELSLLRQMKNNPSFVFDNENGDESERETGRIPNMDPENINTAGSPPGLHRSEVPTDDEINNSGPVHDSSGSASLSRSDRSLGVFESVRSPATITRSIASRASGSRAALPYNSNDSNSGYKAARDINRAAKILEQLNSSLAAISEQIVELSSYEEQENNVHDATMHH
uniref:Cyclic nucleotide-binding domain-containing protein n=1 Tax=Timspurckia oligopyrenoides TaxID=708627 RepID=A0A7S1EP67_9RHOD